MLVITTEIYPFGDKSKKRTLSRVEIINTDNHPESPEVGRYIVRRTTKEGKLGKTGTVTTIPYFLRSRGHFALVEEAFSTMEEKDAWSELHYKSPGWTE